MKMQKRHRGYTLIEVLTVLSVSATVLGVSIGWIHQSMKLASIVQERDTHHRSLLRFSRQFRDDVHQAATVDHQPANRKLLLSLEGRQVSYTIRERSIQRLESRGGEVVAQEAYPLAEAADARWLGEQVPESIGCVVIRGKRIAAANAGDRNVGVGNVEDRVGPAENPQTIDSTPTEDSSAAMVGELQPAIDLYLRVSPGRWDRIRNNVTSEQETTP